MSLAIIKEIIVDQSTLIGVHAGYHLMINGVDNLTTTVYRIVIEWFLASSVIIIWTRSWL